MFLSLSTHISRKCVVSLQNYAAYFELDLNSTNYLYKVKKAFFLSDARVKGSHVEQLGVFAIQKKNGYFKMSH